MKPLPHRYVTQLAGGPSGYARLSASGLPDLPAAPPLEYDGPGDAWSPEHLLLASVQSCFLFTLRSVAHFSKLAFSALDVETEGFVEREGGVVRFTSIVLRPTITVATGTDHAQVRRVLEKSEHACLVSSSLFTPVRLEPRIVEVNGAALQVAPVEA